MLSPARTIKVLAFTLTYETQTVLVVINLSRFFAAENSILKLGPEMAPPAICVFGHGGCP